MFSKIVRIILRPFAGIIRYGALKVMMRLRAPGDRRPVIASSGHILDEIILPSVFTTFKAERFRELANFKKLPVSEQDRIFNELEVAGICLAIFYLRLRKSLVNSEDYQFWQEVERHLPKQLQKILIGYGTDGANAKKMGQLIDERREEYEEIASQAWEASDNLKSEFRNLAPEMKTFAARAQATAVGTVDHIRRGKIKEGDPLIKYLVAWLMALYKDIEKFVTKL